MKLYPAILTESFLQFQQELDAVREHPAVDVMHVDVIDGAFADHITVTPLDLSVTDFDPLKVDFHFMVEEPMDFVYEAVGIKEFLPIRRMYGQIERMSFQKDFLDEVEKHGWQAGLGLDLFTPLDSIDEEVWPQLKYLLMMGVPAGEQYQVFHKHAFEKLEELKQIQNKHPQLTVLLDGGVKLTNIKSILAAGADEVAVGSTLWEAPDPGMIIDEFYRLSADNSAA